MAGQQSVPGGTNTPITPPASVAQQAVGGLVPLNAPNPTAGAPSADDIMKLYGAAMAQGWQMPGATTMHMATPAPTMRMPAQPQMMPLQPTQVQPVTSSLEERRRARAASWGNTLGNALTMVANQKKQQAYQDRVTTLKEYQDARIHRDEAMRTLKLYPNDKAAQQVLRDADAEIYRMENDKKQGKMLADSMPNYTDPKKDKFAEARKEAAQKAYEDDMRGLNNDTPQEQAVSNKADQVAGIPPPLVPNPATQKGAAPAQQSVPVGGVPSQGVPPSLLAPNAPQQPAGAPQVQPQAQTVPAAAPQQAQSQGPLPPAQRGQLNVRGTVTPTQGIPPGASAAARKEATGWQPKFNFPTKLDVTPEYSTAMTQQMEYQKELLTKVVPELEKQAVEIYKVQTQQGNQNWRQIQRDNTQLAEKYMEWVSRANIGDARNKMELDKQRIASQGQVQAAQVRAGIFTTALLSDPRFAPFASVYADKLIGQNNKQLDGIIQSQRVLEQQIADTKAQLGNDPTHPGHPVPPGSPERQRLEEQIRRLNTQMEIQMDAARRIQEQNAIISTTAAQAQQGQGGQGGAPTTSGQPGAGGAPRTQSGVEWQDGKTPSGLDTSGDYQRWLPLVSQVVQAHPEYQNVPPPFVQAYLMVENRKGDPKANPQPADKAKGILQGGQGMFQMIPTEQKKWGVTDPYNAENNTTGAMKMFSTVLAQNHGDVNALIDYVAPKDKNNRPRADYVAKLRSVYNQLAGGGGGTGGGAGATTGTNSPNLIRPGASGAAQPTGTAGATGSKPSAGTPAGITGEAVAAAHQAYKEAFGYNPFDAVQGGAPVPTSPDYSADEGSSSSSYDAENAADDAANQ